MSSRWTGALVAVVLLGCAACSGTAAAGDRPQVVAAFYPLAWAAEQVGGGDVEVTDLTPPGGDGHSLELSPRQVAAVGEADVVVYLRGLQAPTDDAVRSQRPERVVDAARAGGAEPAATDPHVWLDPTRMAAIGDAVADQLAAADPDGAAGYRRRAETLRTELGDLDDEMQAGLAGCAGATLVTSHEAFGYLAERYGLHQVGIAGIDPEVEPSPARVREVVQVVRGADVGTLFFETRTSPDVTAALAEDLGVGTDVLDPLETRAAADTDYLDVMRDNLAALQRGLTCS